METSGEKQTNIVKHIYMAVALLIAAMIGGYFMIAAKNADDAKRARLYEACVSLDRNDTSGCERYR